MEMIKEKMVTQKDLASTLKSGNADVLSTPTVLAWMEETASEFAQTFLSGDEITVGAHVTLDHVAPVWPGEKVTVVASLLERKSRKFSFYIEMRVADKLIAKANHIRVAVKRKDFSREDR